MCFSCTSSKLKPYFTIRLQLTDSARIAYCLIVNKLLQDIGHNRWVSVSVHKNIILEFGFVLKIKVLLVSSQYRYVAYGFFHFSRISDMLLSDIAIDIENCQLIDNCRFHFFMFCLALGFRYYSLECSAFSYHPFHFVSISPFPARSPPIYLFRSLLPAPSLLSSPYALASLPSLVP